MIRHIMLVALKPEASQGELAAAQHAFNTIGDKIPGILGVEWGENDSPEGKNKGYQLAIVMTFADELARQGYLVHPQHDELKVHFRKIISDIIVIDYTL